MRRMLTFVAPLFAGAILLFPKPSPAQHAGGRPRSAPRSMAITQGSSLSRPVYGPSYAASPRLGVRIVAQGLARPRMGSRPQQSAGARHTRHINLVPFDSFAETDFQDVPGLGFDFPHLAAIRGNRHFGHQRFGASFPFGFGGGFFLPTEPVIIEEAPGEPARQGEDALDALATGEGDAVRDTRPQRRASAQNSGAQTAPSSVAPAERDAAEYVFVRRDGELLFAVAYTWQNETLRYITREGLRRTIMRDALDLNATEQFNEQRGLSFHSPA